MGIDKTWRGIRSACRLDLGSRGTALAMRCQTQIKHCTQQVPRHCSKLNLPWAFWQRHQALCWRSCFCATHPSAGEVRGSALEGTCSSCLASREEMLGKMGAEAESEAGPKEKREGIVKVPLIPNLSLYLTTDKDNILLSFQRLLFSAFLAALQWWNHSRKENVLQTYLEGTRDVLFVKEYKIA